MDNNKRQKDNYRHTLEQQMLMKELDKNNYGKMTFQEKRMNKVDLNRFKNHEDSTTALVPGINHISSVASRPLAKGAFN